MVKLGCKNAKLFLTEPYVSRLEKMPCDDCGRLGEKLKKII
jgi:hypothetical protein